MKNIKTIVLTGGPCGGKTTGISKLIQSLSDCGYKVIVIPEVATEIINSGIKPSDETISNFLFQTYLLEFQIKKEKFYKKIANKIKAEKIIIICDRGAMDGKAYIFDADFKKILANQGLNEVILRDSYDAVFHLQTAAIGAEEYYTLENNIAREETIEEAAKIDESIVSAWTGHPHYRIIDNSTDFEIKINRLIIEVYSFLGEPIPLEIERKFLIKMPNIENLIKFEKCQMVEISQTYLKNESSDIEERIRQRGVDGSYIYFHTTKKRVSDTTRIEIEERITKNQYLTLLMRADNTRHQIVKKRYCFMYKNLYFELDVYPFWNEVAILEIELTNQNQQFEIPYFIDVIKDVTNNEEFKNNSIAIRIPKIC
jgi:CYTH domain-containing protein/nucleoside-triphosphatase THEP1